MNINNEIAYFKQNPFEKLIQVLLIVGAINWGLIAYNGTDFVRNITQLINYQPLDKYLKLAVGIAGVYTLYKLILAGSVAPDTTKN